MKKIIVTAIALAFAFPAAAQTAPVAQHQGHGQHHQGQSPAGHGQHQPGQHQPGQHQPGQHQPGQHQPGQHEEHEEHQGGCCADRNGNGRMDCCEEAAAGTEPCACCHDGPASGDRHGH